MLDSVSISKRVSLTFDERFPIEGTVVGVERGDDDRVEAILLDCPLAEGGTVYFDAGMLAAARVSVSEPPTPLLN